MKANLGATGLLAALLALASLGLAAEQQGAPAAAVPTVSMGALSPETPPSPGPAAASVPMVELVLRDNTVVTGRLVKEDAQTVQVTSFGGSSIGYGRDLIQTMRRYALRASEFAEHAGDYRAGQLWETADGPGVYMKARDQYQQALLLAAAPEERDRVQGKIAALEKERDALQAEALRQRELQKAADEADAARLQKQLTQQQIAAVQALDPRLRQVEQAMHQVKLALLNLQGGADRIGRAVDDLGRGLTDLQDDVDYLQRNYGGFVPYSVFNDLQRSQQRLEQEVDRLKRDARKP